MKKNYKEYENLDDIPRNGVLRSIVIAIALAIICGILYALYELRKYK